MFKRLILEDWHHTLPYISFALTFAVFIYFVVKALRMKQEDVDHRANLPLENDQPSSTNRNH